MTYVFLANFLTFLALALPTQSLSETFQPQGATIVLAGLVGEESARLLPVDPSSSEAQNAEASGPALFCDKSVGTLNLVRHNDAIYLIGSSHAFNKFDIPKCSNKVGYIFPDAHYQEGTLGINRIRKYAFGWPPLNDATRIKGQIGKTDPRKLNDLAIFAVIDMDILKRQNGDPRQTITMGNVASSELVRLSETVDIFNTASRHNFHGHLRNSFESGCKINNYVDAFGRDSPLKKHSCDTGKGSSGSSLNFLDASQNLFSLGLHYGGRDSTISDFEDRYSQEGNFFIPSSHIIKVLDEIQKRAGAKP